MLRRQNRDTNRNIKRSVHCQVHRLFSFLSDGWPTLETLDYTIRSVRTPTLLYFDKLFVDCSIYCVAAVDGGRHTGLVVVNVA